MYFVSGGGLEVHLDADPDPEHSLAFMWLCKENPGTFGGDTPRRFFRTRIVRRN